ncbi:ASST-domain-containing protein [Aspergillus cavernicola]|uniref:ASST-domain-containing protein n=1 Tax=Aspergillus cavernicola TaxID=176166 RepID=A0ABR4I256_9EURO
MWHPFLLAFLLHLARALYVPFPEPDHGEPWPTKIYHSSSILGPTVFFTSSIICNTDGEYTFLSPRGDGVSVRGPIIVDQEGELVWASDYHYQAPVYNLDVQTYKGQDYITFWMGDADVAGHGDGAIYMLDASYNEVYKVRGPGGLSADFHEFQITRDETALFTVYDVVPADLRSINGPRRGWIWDCRFVEVDIETNEVLYQWRASEHFDFTEVAQSRGTAGQVYQTAWDFFHINSVDKDAKGNYLISALYVDHLTYIDGRTGDTVWRLGGNQSDFKDISSYPHKSPTFAWPHHARFRDNDTAITLFDNASPNDATNRGVYLDLDQSKMTVKLRYDFPAPEYDMTTPSSHPQSQGSVQVLDTGNVLVSYGLNGAGWSEFDKTGFLRCDAHFGHTSSFGTGSPASYRVSKHPWKGYPSTTPSLEVTDSKVAVSWNGATEVETWVLEGAYVPHPKPYNGSGSDSDFAAYDQAFTLYEFPKTGFETISLVPYAYPYVRVRALTANGTHLGTSSTLPFTLTPPIYSNPHHHYNPSSKSHSPAFFFAGVAATVALAGLVYILRRWCCCSAFLRRRLRRLRRYRPRSWDDDDEYEHDYGYVHESGDGEAGEQEIGILSRERRRGHEHGLGMSDSDSGESDDSDEVEVSVLENPRLSPMFIRDGSWPNSPRSPGGSSNAGADAGGERPVLLRTPSALSSSSAGRSGQR